MSPSVLPRLLVEFLQTAYSGGGDVAADIRTLKKKEFWRSLSWDDQQRGEIFLGAISHDAYFQLHRDLTA